MYNALVCRYHEIATKGNNRNMFEICLVENLRHILRPRIDCAVRRVRGRVWVEPSGKEWFSDSDIAAAGSLIPRVFGLESFSPVVKLPTDWEIIKKTVLESAERRLTPVFAVTDKISFRIRARRSFKRFPLSSNRIEIELVTLLGDKFGDNRFQIDLDNAEYTLGVEVRDEFSLLFWETFRAPGGLPVGSNPRVLTLLSGGIDSPVAAWQIMKRGCPTDFISFHSAPYTPSATTEKVTEIAAFLNTFQRNGTLYLCNLAPFQKLVRDCCTERFRTVLYRRAMLRIAEKVAVRTGCKALVTGDSVGQVASQTLVNLDTVGKAVDMLILRPLTGADKLETIRIAEQIGSMKYSAVQVPDSCTVFAPSNPATAAPVHIIENEEMKIPDYAAVLEKITADTLNGI